MWGLGGIDCESTNDVIRLVTYERIAERGFELMKPIDCCLFVCLVVLCAAPAGAAEVTANPARSVVAASGSTDRSYLAMGKQYQDAGNYRRALVCFQREIVAATDGNVLAESYVREAECLFRLDRLEKALAAAKSVAGIQDRHQSFLKKRGEWILQAAPWEARVLMRRNLYAEAVKACDEALAQALGANMGQTATTRIMKANALVLSGKVEEAVGVARAMRAEDTSQGTIIVADVLEGDLYHQADRYPEAIEVYLRLIGECANSKERSAYARFELALCYHDIGDHAKARAYLNEVITDYASTSWKSVVERHLNDWYPDQATESGQHAKTAVGSSGR